MIAALALSLTAYAWIILRRWFAWNKLPEVEVPVNYKPITKLSVVVPVRNEATHITQLLQDLENQRYPKELFEVLIVDDHSEDGTPELVRAYATTSNLQLRVVELKNYINLKQKKDAVKTGVEQVKGELIVLTDGDCRVQPEWLALFEYTYKTQNALFISGPVCFHNTHTLFERMQLVEFASLIGIGGASIMLGKPNMCNGANLAYAKGVFEQVGGFSGNEGVVSGDDEFLLHKVSERFPGRVAFLKNNKATVFTEARKSIRSFVSQRVRWASKWKAYQNWQVQLVALIVFIINLLLFLAMPMLLFKQLSTQTFIVAYCAKFAIDCLFLNYVLRFFGRSSYLIYMLPLQLVYIPYVLYTAILGLFGRYSWKGRKIRSR
ncbi:glycosyltransferase [Pontibacter silvestris]|uniref:Glycosyltransferase n=1 Tax=Pontibacter silvestris TaxID=2305183 RepID=A0ABW4X0Q1_9BACT|nr:glycosyltransferase [Pontibacter silvestris]MCC9137500.1 glycosyltransferase [Pontibacter silvestris]